MKDRKKDERKKDERKRRERERDHCHSTFFEEFKQARTLAVLCTEPYERVGAYMYNSILSKYKTVVELCTKLIMIIVTCSK